MYQLPDQYLTEADIAVELDYCSACGHEIERP